MIGMNERTPSDCRASKKLPHLGQKRNEKITSIIERNWGWFNFSTFTWKFVSRCFIRDEYWSVHSFIRIYSELTMISWTYLHKPLFGAMSAISRFRIFGTAVFCCIFTHKDSHTHYNVSVWRDIWTKTTKLPWVQNSVRFPSFFGHQIFPNFSVFFNFVKTFRYPAHLIK